MKKTISILLTYLIGLQLSAQNFNVTFAESQEESHLSASYAVPGGFIGMKYKVDIRPAQSWTKRRQTISILRYDASMKPVKENRLANGEKAFGVVYTSFKKSGDKFWLIYTDQTANNQIGDFKAVKVDALTLEASEPKIIAASGETNFTPSYAFIEGKIEFKSSPNGKHHCLFMITGKKIAVVCLLDEELNQLWNSKAIAKDIDIDPADINSVEVDNQGTIYLGYVKDDYGHVAIYKNSKIPQILDVKLDKGKPKEVMVLAHKNTSNVSIAGGYVEDSKNVRGVYKATLDASSKISGMVKSPFSDDIVKLFDADSWGSIKPNKYGIEPEYITQIFEVDDKTIDMVIEIKHKIHVDKIGWVVHSGNILNVYFNNSNAVFTRIPKYNVAAGTAWPHYHALPFQNKMVIFYNDNPANLKRDINASPKLVDIEDNSVLVAAVVQPNGSVERRLPLERQEKYMGVAEWIKPVAESQVQVPVYTKKKLNYAMISLQ